ncbi:microtubule-associated protein futsch-like [Camellia sinensis]|uniref:microtubule-associated protein futsch-like n=1 Tax=Camellia sinensis TaxID=4442 RepID=UPI00103584C9|nr:microtubule-associated protein futsch-like [Camellia sinensis]
MGHKKAVVENLLADIPDSVDAQPAQTQPQPKSKPKRLKKAQPKATVTQIDTEGTFPISKLAESEKTPSAAEKRPAEAQPSESTKSKRLRSSSATTSRPLKHDSPWAPPITIDDKPVKASDNANDIEHSVQAIQHTHSFSMQSFETRKELADKTREAASLQRAAKKTEAKMKTLSDQAEEAIKAEDEAEEKADAAEAIAIVLTAKKKEAEAKMAEAQKELQHALATKEAEIKAADERAYAEGAADVKEDYKKQVKQLDALEDSPLKNVDVLSLPFPPTPSQSKDNSKSEEEALVRKPKEAVAAKSPTPNKQVLDLTHDEDGEVSKDTIPDKATSDVPIADKSLDQTLQEIDVELATERAAEMSSQQSSELQTQPPKDAEES